MSLGEKTQLAATALGFSSLGAAVGLALGMSASPIIAASMTAGFTLVGTLIPIYLAKVSASGETGPKPLPIAIWLFPFAASLALAMVGGAAIRVNNALDFRAKVPPEPETNLRDHFAKLGFSIEQVDKIMDRLSLEVHKDALVEVEPKVISVDNKRESSIQSGGSSKIVWTDFWTKQVEKRSTSVETLQQLQIVAPTELTEEIKKHADQIIESLKKNHP